MRYSILVCKKCGYQLRNKKLPSMNCPNCGNKLMGMTRFVWDKDYRGESRIRRQRSDRCVF